MIFSTHTTSSFSLLESFPVYFQLICENFLSGSTVRRKEYIIPVSGLISCIGIHDLSRLSASSATTKIYVCPAVCKELVQMLI